MNRLKTKLNSAINRQNRVRRTIRGNSTLPRLSVYISNKNISAQIIDDATHTTIAAVSTVSLKTAKGTMTERAQAIGTEIAKKAKAKKVLEVAFDRGPRLYHGRVKALAESARKEGLKF